MISKFIRMAGIFMLLLLTKTALAAPDLVVGTVSGDAGDTVNVPLTFTNGVFDADPLNDSELIALTFELTYDDNTLSLSPDNATVEAAINAALAAGYPFLADATTDPNQTTVKADTTTDGVIVFSITPLNGFVFNPVVDVTLSLPFTIEAGAAPDSSTPIQLTNIVSGGVGGAVAMDTTTDGAVDINALPLPVVTITATNPNASEPATNGEFTLTRTGDTTNGLDVDLEFGGTADGNLDYNAINLAETIPAGQSSVAVSVTVIDDSDIEPTETVIATIIAPRAGNTSVYNIDMAANSATVNIADDDAPTVSISATDASEPSTAGSITISRVGGDTTAELSVGITITGTATAGADYNTLISPVVIPANQLSIETSLTPINDTDVEGNETVIVTIAENAAAYVIDGTGSAQANIADDDVPVGSTISLTQGGAAIANGDTDSFGNAVIGEGSIVHTYTLANNGATDVTVDLSLLAATANNGASGIWQQFKQALASLNPISAAWAVDIGDFTINPTSVIVPTGGTASYTITFTPSAPAGSIQAQVTLSIGGAAFSTYQIAGTGILAPVVGAGPANIPTMSEWVMILLLLTLGVVATRMSRRQR